MNLFADYDVHELASLSNGAACRLSSQELQCSRAAARGLMLTTKTSSAQLWGKVAGLKADYIVIFLYNEDPLHEGDAEGASYWMSTDGGKRFTLLPPPFEVAARVAEIGTAPVNAAIQPQGQPDRVKARVLAADAAGEENSSIVGVNNNNNNNIAASSLSKAAAGQQQQSRSTAAATIDSPVRVRGADNSNSSLPDSALPSIALGALRLDFLCRMLTGPFSGDAALEYRIPAERLGGTTSSSKQVAFCIREVDRLCCLVHEVNTHCTAVPRGAVEQRERPVIDAKSSVPSAAASGGVAQAKKNAAVLQRLPLKVNPHFRGLSRADAGRLSSYLHLRALTERVTTELEKEGAAATLDCLEPLSIDEPATVDSNRPGAWTLRYEPVADVVYGVSNTFPGAMFYHQPETANYGCVYVGDGMQSQDVLPYQL